MVTVLGIWIWFGGTIDKRHERDIKKVMIGRDQLTVMGIRDQGFELLDAGIGRYWDTRWPDIYIDDTQREHQHI